MRYYKWGYTWDEIRKLYVLKHKEIADRTNVFADFLVTLTTAALGGKSNTSEVSVDNGEGIEELSDEALLKMKETLGEHDFYTMYPKLIGVI